MSSLDIYAVSAPEKALLSVTQAERIAEELAKIGVGFERWAPKAPLPRDADDRATQAAYADDIERISKAEGYISVDVIRLFPDNPNRDDIRAKFLAEHTHADDEARFFVEGSGVFYIHVGEKVFMVLCEAGDVPQETPHWFDTGARPHLTVIRWFKRPDGWVARFTGGDYSDIFPKYERAQRVA
jgi:1,2-dihydroxy-3-keto-5-methylthiopentene dioxygenase